MRLHLATTTVWAHEDSMDIQIVLVQEAYRRVFGRGGVRSFRGMSQKSEDFETSLAASGAVPAPPSSAQGLRAALSDR